MTELLKATGSKWVRAKDGWFAGVCEGLGRSFGIEPWIIRMGWFISIFFFGTGLLLYLILAFTLPREDQMHEAEEKKFMGVCHRIARETGTDVGLVRAITVILGMCSLGATFVGYIVLHFVLAEDPDTIVA